MMVTLDVLYGPIFSDACTAGLCERERSLSLKGKQAGEERERERGRDSTTGRWSIINMFAAVHFIELNPRQDLTL